MTFIAGIKAKMKGELLCNNVYSQDKSQNERRAVVK